MKDPVTDRLLADLPATQLMHHEDAIRAYWREQSKPASWRDILLGLAMLLVVPVFLIVGMYLMEPTSRLTLVETPPPFSEQELAAIDALPLPPRDEENEKPEPLEYGYDSFDHRGGF